jgi:hypothetical protein
VLSSRVSAEFHIPLRASRLILESIRHSIRLMISIHQECRIAFSCYTARRMPTFVNIKVKLNEALYTEALRAAELARQPVRIYCEQLLESALAERRSRSLPAPAPHGRPSGYGCFARDPAETESALAKKTIRSQG